jgi:ankyrin repeat protein
MEIFEAIESGDLARVRELVAADPSVASARGADGVSAVLQARYRFQLEIVDALLAVRPELDVFDAAGVGETDRLRELLDEDGERANAWSADGFTPLHLAAFFGHEEGARLLLERGADPHAVARNPLGVQPLHSAAAGSHRGICEALLDAGADPDARQAGGFVPLHAAAQNGDRELADLLLAHGADPAAAADDGRSPADLATGELAQSLRR